jgi:hypothetical protein
MKIITRQFVSLEKPSVNRVFYYLESELKFCTRSSSVFVVASNPANLSISFLKNGKDMVRHPLNLMWTLLSVWKSCNNGNKLIKDIFYLQIYIMLIIFINKNAILQLITLGNILGMNIWIWKKTSCELEKDFYACYSMHGDTAIEGRGIVCTLSGAYTASVASTRDGFMKVWAWNKHSRHYFHSTRSAEDVTTHLQL